MIRIELAIFVRMIVFLFFVIEIEPEIGCHMMIHYFLNNFYSRTTTIICYV